ncbi:MAG TPA: GNAT family N-acetyltransferase [Burkholderiales bacterium]|nr:GNAT family N-acetyltransferase [Burkholderiales bacterium]
MRRRPAGTGIIIEVRSDLAELRAIVPDWEALAAEAAEPNPFYEHWMLLPALEAYGAGEDFQCILVWENGTLAGLFPMQRERRFHGMPVGVLRSWRHRNMLLCCTPLLRARSAVKCIEALLQSPLAPVVELEWMPADGPVYAALIESVLAAGMPWLVTDAYARALLQRDRDPRERFNSNMKNNLRRWQARLSSHGEVAPVRLAADGDLARWTDEFLRLEASGWKAQEGSALACREDDRRFVAAIFPEAFRRGRLLITGLDLAGKPLARHCMIAGGEGAFTFKIAYDETYASCSPGILAEVDNVRQFLETPGPRWVDSNTSRENTSYGRVWKDRRTFQRVAVGLRGAGRFAVAALPFLRLTRRALGRVALRQHGLNGPMKRGRIPVPQTLR